MTELTLVAARLLLAFVFLLAGATKLTDPVGFRKTWSAFGLPAVLAPPIVVLLPMWELAVGGSLILARLAWYGAWGALALLTVFILALGLAMARGRRPECRCFGRVHSAPLGWQTIARDGSLAACAGWLIQRGPLRSGPNLWAWFNTLNEDLQKAAVLAGLAIVFVFLRQLARSRPQSEPVEAQPVPETDEDEEQPPALESRSAQGIGLPIGTLAPEFDLPGAAGERRSLQSLRQQGSDILLVFSNPYCEPCQALASKLVRWTREMEGILNIVLVTRGAVRDNLAKLNGFDASRVLLQRGFEISEAYDCNATPAAVVVGADGLIRTQLVVGRDPIQQLVASYAKARQASNGA